MASKDTNKYCIACGNCEFEGHEKSCPDPNLGFTVPGEEINGDYRAGFDASRKALLAENRKLRETLTAFVYACEKADAIEELSDCIDGSLIDKAREILCMSSPTPAPGSGETVTTTASIKTMPTSVAMEDNRVEINPAARKRD